MTDRCWKVVEVDDDYATTTYVYLEGTRWRGAVLEDEDGVWYGKIGRQRTAYYFDKAKAIEAVKSFILDNVD